MYVSGFGGSWFEHPFWRAKFLLESPDEVARVRNANVPFVLIDDALGLAPDQPSQPTSTFPQSVPSFTRQSDRERFKERATSHSARKRQEAKKLLLRSKEVMRGVFEDARLGCAIHSPSMNGVVEDIIGAVSVESQIFLTVARLKSKDDYTYLHSVAVCALMVSVGRHLGMAKSEVHDLGIAGLLHDVGKMAIPDAILNKQASLTDKEFENIRTHPEKGYQLLLESPRIPKIAMDVCRHHHEKMDGTGYPFGLRNEELSFAVRLGAICDVYDALTSNRAYKKAWSPHKALGEMSQWEGHFDLKILAALAQAIGIFPSGLLVRLSSGRLALLLGNDSGQAEPSAITFVPTPNGAFVDPQRIPLGQRKDEESVIFIEKPADHGIADWDTMSTELRSAV